MKKYLVPVRRAVQAAVFILISAIVWNTAFPLERFINPSFLFQLDPLAMLVTSLAERVLIPGLALSALMIALTFIFGRFFCGWLCPLGALMDFAAWPLKRVQKAIALLRGTGESGRGRYVKYFILAAVSLPALAGYQLAWIFDPVTIFVRTFSMSVHPPLNSALEAVLGYAAGGPAFMEGFHGYLRGTLISPEIPVFEHSGLILAICAAVILPVVIRRRFWCRYICPLGALYALNASPALLERRTGECIKNCSICARGCRMGAIRDDGSYMKSECVICMDCVSGCPVQSSTFSFRKEKIKVADQVTMGTGSHECSGCSDKSFSSNTMSRAVFMRAAAGTMLAAAAPSALFSADEAGGGLLRPPGALPGDNFLARCIRCGNCMKVCPANFLQPASHTEGLLAMWSPVGNTTTGYCEYECNLCGVVCPTGAIAKLTIEEKTVFKMGLAEINKKTCVPWIRDENCIVCEEHCPLPVKAIKLEKHYAAGKLIKRPVIDRDLCTGCAICENRCPVEGEKGVVVKPVS